MESSATAEGTSRLARWRAAARAAEWWEYKLVPVLGVFYATALHGGQPIATLWPSVLLLLAALVPGAVYVSVINDLTDRADDAAAGKHNRMAGRSRAEAGALIGLPVAAGIMFLWMWRHDGPLFWAYLGAWIAFSLYSLPPFRLKKRGAAGVVADASGAHLFPSTVAALLVYAAAGAKPDLPWLTAVGVWAGAYGLRGILWHQLSDRAADRAAGVRTFAERHDPDRVAMLVRRVVFPVEIAALIVMLARLSLPLPILAVAVYLVTVWLRSSWWKMTVVLAQPRPRYILFMHDFYDVLLPLSLLCTSALLHPVDGLVVVAHLLVFPGRAREVGRQYRELKRQRRSHVPPLKEILRRIGRVFR